MAKEKEEIEEPSAPFWMTTYGDMVTLMLCFFILLISYSTMQIEKFQGALESFRGALGILSGHESAQKKEFINFEDRKTPINVQMNEALNELEKQLVREANQLGIGPMGFGGKTTVLGAKIGVLHRLPACYFVSIAYMCWACRRRTMTFKDNEVHYD